MLDDLLSADFRQCAHDLGVDCDGLFHYCRLCSTPLDDCPCPRGG